MGAPEYTRCVNPKDYEEPGFGAEIFLLAAGLVYAIPTFGLSLIASMAAAMSALLKVCDYVLYGKLVCLGGDKCAVGRVAAFETVDDKSGLDKLDNDFSINLLLAPHSLSSFAGGSHDANYKAVAEDSAYGPQFQGYLIKEQPDMPIPREYATGADGLPLRYTGTFTTFPNSSYISYNPPPVPGTPFDVPVLHCEIEGDRAYYVCTTLAAIASLIPGASSFCRWKPFGIPIGHWVCAIIAAILSPIIFAALAAAWIAGSDDNRSFDGAGSLQRGDSILVYGRWTYDAGHSGWNEIHPVKKVQKIDDSRLLDWTTFQDTIRRWCPLVQEVPPDSVPGTKPATMTPGQETVYHNQQKPENQWILHPDIDGCAGSDKPSGATVIH